MKNAQNRRMNRFDIMVFLLVDVVVLRMAFTLLRYVHLSKWQMMKEGGGSKKSKKNLVDGLQKWKNGVM